MESASNRHPSDRGGPLPDARDGPGPPHRRTTRPTPRAQKATCAERVSTRIGAETAGLKGDKRDEAVLKINSEECTAEAKIARAVAGVDLTFSPKLRVV
jgi:hypothetical protein